MNFGSDQPGCLYEVCFLYDSPTECGLIIEFESQDFENMLLHDEEALECLRFRSVPLQGDDCSRIKEGEHVLAAHKSQFRSCFYDAKVEKVHALCLYACSIEK